jgi:hypothetical protein
VVSEAYRRLTERETARLAIHRRVRDEVDQAMVGLTRAQAAYHVAEQVRAALAPAGPHYAEWTAQMMRRQADALDTAVSATRKAGFALRQFERITRRLTDGE